jgi:hypothetical protein
MDDIKSLFGLDGTRFIRAVDELALTKIKISYSFMKNDDFAQYIRENLRLGMQVYWNEILIRAHLTSVIAILRSRHWINAVLSAMRNKNLLAFAAALRGFIESAADTSSALKSVPHTFARYQVQINRALSAQSEDLFLGKEIEDELIHFSYARHLTKAELTAAPSSHKARQIRDYINILEKGQVYQVIPCYQSLCDLTHPGASSVWMWLASRNDVDIVLKPDQDESVIASYLTEYRDTFLELLMFSFNPALVTLNVLNYFSVQTLHTPKLLNWDLSGIPIWQKCQADLAGALPLAHTGLRLVKPSKK